ncbi:hypothetical protein CUR178_08284 [Leishmania enriettii]|uniref:Uncharacterized protein n=1 Tax=Leishmania enriettii TaxID=5663 RepID=A0A836HCH0_LEIEN|nr:hypothetical protein CUR178_08284 [Leishmania enriettii]
MVRADRRKVDPAHRCPCRPETCPPRVLYALRITATFRTCLASCLRRDSNRKRQQETVIAATFSEQSSNHATIAGDRHTFDLHHCLAQPNLSSASTLPVPVMQAHLPSSSNSLHGAMISPPAALQQDGAALEGGNCTASFCATAKAPPVPDRFRVPNRYPELPHLVECGLCDDQRRDRRPPLQFARSASLFAVLVQRRKRFRPPQASPQKALSLRSAPQSQPFLEVSSGHTLSA